MQSYRWARWGDLNAFFGLMLDNVAVMGILLTAIVSSKPPTEQLGFTAEFVLTRMIPGTALGVLLGDLVYTWMAFSLAKRTGRDDVTAMPLGLDTPSTFGVAFLVLLPALGEGWRRYNDHQEAMDFAWHVGLMTLTFCGVFKILCAPFGNLVRRIVPRAGLLGSLAAIALVLIAFLPMLLDGIAGAPVVGMLALLVILITLVAHRELPFQFPGALAAVAIGVAIYFIGMAGGLPLGPALEKSSVTPRFDPMAMFSFYSRPWSWWLDVASYSVNYLPIALPFALATIVGGIDCTESAAAAGDEYDTRAVLWTEGLASLVAGLLGGVIQTTPYIGQPAYKKMGGRAAYTLMTALFVGIVGVLGGFIFIIYLPPAALFPILVFVGLEITAKSFHATPPKHYPALALAMLPALAALALVVLKNLYAPGMPPTPSGERGLFIMQTLRCLSNGFLITGMLWAAALVMILDGKLISAGVYFLIAGVCAFFGIIHSPLSDERIGLPWHIMESVDKSLAKAVSTQTPYHWLAAYMLMALVLAGLALASRKAEPTTEQTSEGVHPSPS